MVHCALLVPVLPRVQGIRESHDLKINLARDVSRDGGGAAAATSVITSTIDCAIVYKLSWTQPLSVATPAQYREHEYTGGNIWVLIADIKFVMWTRQTIDVVLTRTERVGLWMECQVCFCFMSSHHTLCTQVHFKSQKSFSIISTQDGDNLDNFIWIQDPL